MSVLYYTHRLVDKEFEMFVEAMVSSCDMNDYEYDGLVQGAMVLAQGGTGRWCAVMYCGPEWVAQNNATIYTYDEAVKILTDKGVPEFQMDF